MKEIIGLISRVFFSKDNWASVLIDVDKDGSTIRAAGSIVNPVVGTRMLFMGDFENDPKWGEQFKIKSSRLYGKMTKEGLIGYLSSGFITGIGEKTARKIVDTFGDNTLDIIENHPIKLATIPRISLEKAKEISKMYKASSVYMEIYQLFGNKITDNQVKNIYAAYGEKAVKVIQNNPYQLIHDIDGFGFRKVDALALNYGIPKNSPVRIGAALSFALTEESQKGHCYSNLLSLQAEVNNLLELPGDAAVTGSELGHILADEIKQEHFVYEEDGNRLYLPHIYKSEVYCAKQVAKMVRCTIPTNTSDDLIEDGIERTEREYGFKLESTQKQAVVSALKNHISIITGGPGTGKTTAVRAILNCYNGNVTYLVAPTGKASRRMSECTGRDDAITIHRLLIEKKKKNSKYEYSGLIICDEASMLDINLAAKLLEFADDTHSQLCLIGDIDQLPPIGPGNFFRDLVKSPFVPTVKLALCHRQKGKIAINAQKINYGESYKNYEYDDSFEFIKSAKEEAQQNLLDKYFEFVEEYGVSNVGCIVPTRQAKGENADSKVASDALNKKIREKLNPMRANSVMIPGCDFRVNDRVMQTSNDYEKGVFNGDCGYISCIDKDDNLIYVKMDDGRVVEYAPFETSSLTLAYAMTVHKSQGSEYKAVVLGQCTEHWILLQRNLLYTGVTRAKDKVAIVGDVKSMGRAVSNTEAINRNTLLQTRIKDDIVGGKF